MRKNLGANNYLYPMPVLILAGYDENGKVEVMNAAWGGTVGMNKIAMCVTPTHKSIECIRQKGELTVSMGTADQVVACDYVGIVSGNDEPNKFAKTGWHATKSELIDAPIIDELKLTLECKIASYDEPSHIMICDIVNVTVDDCICGEDGKVDIAKLKPIAYDPINLNYNVMGEIVAKAFSVGAEIK